MSDVDCGRERDASPVLDAKEASGAGDSSVVEQLDDGACERGEFHQRGFHWSARDDINIIEHYLNSDLDLVIRIGDVARQHVAVLRRLRTVACVQFGGQQAEAVNGNASIADQKGNETLMLSNVVKSIEGDQKCIPSEAWLEVFDRRLIGGGKPLYTFVTSAIPFGDISTNRKVRVFYETFAVSLGKCGCQHIETAADAVDDGTGFCVDEKGRRLPRIDLPNLFAGLRIHLGASDVWAIVRPISDPYPERIELGFGPVNTCLERLEDRHAWAVYHRRSVGGVNRPLATATEVLQAGQVRTSPRTPRCSAIERAWRINFFPFS